MWTRRACPPLWLCLCRVCSPFHLGGQCPPRPPRWLQVHDGSVVRLHNLPQSRPEDLPSAQAADPCLRDNQTRFAKQQTPFLNANCRKPTCKAEPSGLSHVWRGAASRATLSPTARPCQTVSNSTSWHSLFSHERGSPEEKGAVRALPTAPGKLEAEPGRASLVSFLSPGHTTRTTREP